MNPEIKLMFRGPAKSQSNCKRNVRAQNHSRSQCWKLFYRKTNNMLLQIVKLSDEVTVSSLPHPISMFFLGIFAVAIIFVMIEVNRFKKEIEKMRNDVDSSKSIIPIMKNELESKLSEVSKKIDSRVDKALLGFKKSNKVLID